MAQSGRHCAAARGRDPGSRGRPTVQTTCELNGRHASDGLGSIRRLDRRGRSHELRDGDPDRYGGLGFRPAVVNVNSEIDQALVGESDR